MCRQLASIPSHLCCLWFPSVLCSMLVQQIWRPLTSTGGPGWGHPELAGVGIAFWWTGKGLFYLLGASTAANLGDDWVMKEGVRQELFLLALRGWEMRLSEGCDQMCWGQPELLVSSQLEAQLPLFVAQCISPKNAMDVLSRCLWLHSLSWSYLLPGKNALLLETSTVAAGKRN